MGHVSEYIKEMVARQVKDNHLVVWFDPEGIYGDIAKDIEIPNGTVAHYRGSFFELRHEIAPIMRGEDPPDLLIYVPLSEEKTDNALIAYTSAGIVLKPHQSPWQRNTSLGVIANQALKEIIDNPADLDEIIKKVDRRELTLADLDALADRTGKSRYQQILALIYRVETPQEIALSFLNRPDQDGEIERKNALDDMRAFLHAEYGAEIGGDSAGTCRGEFARYLLVSTLLAQLDGHVPDPSPCPPCPECKRPAGLCPPRLRMADAPRPAGGICQMGKKDRGHTRHLQPPPRSPADQEYPHIPEHRPGRTDAGRAGPP